MGIYEESQESLTPNISKWAEGNAVFLNAFSAGTWTLPSTTSLLTGKQVWEHRVTQLELEGESITFGTLTQDHEPLPLLLKEKGYRTCAVVNNPFLSSFYGFNQGFDQFNYDGARNDVHRTAADTVEAAVQCLDESPGPTFVLVHFMDPHRDYMVQEETCAGLLTEDKGFSTRALTGDEVEHLKDSSSFTDPLMARTHKKYRETACTVDKAFQQLLEGLEERGRPKWVVLTADHGELFGEDQRYEHGGQPHPMVTHVPLVVSSPESRAFVSNDAVSTASLYPFLLEGEGPISDAFLGVQGEDLARFSEGDWIGYATSQFFFVKNCDDIGEETGVWKEMLDADACKPLVAGRKDQVFKSTSGTNMKTHIQIHNCVSCAKEEESSELVDELMALGYLEE